MPSKPTELCHCGKPLHYTDPAVEQRVRKLIAELGEYVTVSIFDERTWLVPRHYIALHGIRGWEVPQLGFVEVPRGDPR
jgi:hypothetical protein